MSGTDNTTMSSTLSTKDNDFKLTDTMSTPKEEDSQSVTTPCPTTPKDEEEPKQPTTFMSLPPELRLQVYAHALPPQTIKITSLPQPKAPVPPSLLLNKKTHSEALEVYYANTTFLFSSHPLATAWLKTLDPKMVGQIKHIRIDTPRLRCGKLMAIQAQIDLWQMKKGLGFAWAKGVVEVSIRKPDGGVEWTAEPEKRWEELVVEESKEE